MDIFRLSWEIILQIAHQKSKAILYFISQAIYKEGDKLNVEGLKRFSMQAGNLTP